MARPVATFPSRSVNIIAAILIVSALHFAKDILVPLALALLLTFLLAPLANQLQRQRVPRVIAVITVVFWAIGVVGVLAYAVSSQLISVASELPDYRENIHDKIQALRGANTHGPLAKVSDSIETIAKELSEVPEHAVSNTKKKGAVSPSTIDHPMPVQIVKPSSNGLQYLRDISGPILGPLETSIIVLVFTVFMLIERQQLRNRLFHLAGQRQLSVMTSAVDDAAQRVSRYLSMQFLVNASYGALFAAGLYFLHVPFALLWGVLAGVLRFIPYIGTLAAAAMPVTVAIAMSDGWSTPLLAFGLFLVLELAIANGLEPWLYGAHTGVSSVAILLSAIFWTALWGPVGLVLSMPLTVCLVVMGRHIPQLEFLHVLLGDEPVLSTEAHFYQRMLAMDDHEARLIVDQFLTEHTPIELYDSVLIPALRMAERDRHEGAMEEARRRFLFETMYELITELGEKAAPAAPIAALRVLSIAVRDEADEIAGAMLARTLESAGYSVISFPHSANPSELLNQVAAVSADVVVLSAVPPFALSAARSVMKILHARHPSLKIVTGLWNDSANEARLRERIASSNTDFVVTSLAAALECLHGLIDKMRLNDGESPGWKAGSRPDPRGAEAPH